jgi:hypothetical protein
MNSVNIKYTDAYLINELEKYTSKDFFDKYKNDLSLKFCFLHLFERPNESINNVIYYNEIADFYKNKYPLEHIIKIYDTAMFNKNNGLNKKQLVYKIYCKGDCNTCEEKDYCF